MVASQMGCKVSEPNLDNGVDFWITYAERYEVNDRNRILDLGDMIAIQLKCTTTKYISYKNNHLKYDLEVKNFNDLIRRYKNRFGTKVSNIPLILLLTVFDEEQNFLMSLDEIEVKIKARTFWYYPTTNTDYSLNDYKTRISIPLENQINFRNFRKIFQI